MQFKTETLEQAFALIGRQPVTLPEIPGLPESEREYLNNLYNLTVVVAAVNQESNGGKPWEPNYSDGSTKYEPLFEIEADEENPAGSGVSYYAYGYADTLTYVGSRLAFHSVPALKYVAKQFNALYEKVLIKKKK